MDKLQVNSILAAWTLILCFYLLQYSLALVRILSKSFPQKSAIDQFDFSYLKRPIPQTWLPQSIFVNIIAQYPTGYNMFMRAEELERLNAMAPQEFVAYTTKLRREVRDSLMVYERQRLRTFQGDWLLNACQLPAEMASAGLYYRGHSDDVECVFCHGHISDWKPEDVPWARHEDAYPLCRFVNDIPCDNHPDVPQLLPSDFGNVTRFGSSLQDLNESNINQVISQLGINTDRAYNPHFSRLAARTDSFDVWPYDTVISRTLLANAGFYYTRDLDLVRCFQCGVGLRDWQRGNDPLREHAIHFPDCSFLDRSYVAEVRAHAPINRLPQMSTEEQMINLCCQLGHNILVVNAAIAANNGPFDHVGDLIDAIHELEYSDNDEIVEPEVAAPASSEDQSPQLPTHHPTGFCWLHTNTLVPANYVGLPCGHLIYCEQCNNERYEESELQDVKCPQTGCGMRLTGTLKVFFG